MKYLFSCLLFFCISNLTNGLRPKDGTYTYKIAFPEWKGKSLGATCTVVIKGDTIDQGIIMKQTKTGKWIIGHNRKDKEATQIGGCSGGPSLIEFKLKLFGGCLLRKPSCSQASKRISLLIDIWILYHFLVSSFKIIYNGTQYFNFIGTTF
jgi:hypothetical protein